MVTLPLPAVLSPCTLLLLPVVRNIKAAEIEAMKKEIHRMQLRLEQLKRRQEAIIVEMERAIHFPAGRPGPVLAQALPEQPFGRDFFQKMCFCLKTKGVILS